MRDIHPDRLARVYGAALAASAGPAAAAQITGRALARAEGLDDDAAAARAIRLAAREAPAASLALMAPDDREAIALARVARLSSGRVAAELGIGEPEVRRRMLRGLRAQAAAQATAPRPARRPLKPACLLA
jgi:DNA-directed RNA polymerase specialized sigma24 family protein